MTHGPVVFIHTFCAFWLSLTPLSGHASAQIERPEFPPPGNVPEAISFFAPLVIPKTLQDAYQLKDYVCSDEFAVFRRRHGDVISVDAIFHEAMRLSWNNVYEALLISLLVSLEHRRVEFRVPLIGLVIPLPLTPEFEDEFNRRVECLPSKLFPDSPRTPFGDKDKLQHFFGSAFVTYVAESGEGADRLGTFVELGESRYVVGEVIDTRDIRTNRNGQQFGLALLADKQTRPSEFILPVWQKPADTLESSSHPVVPR